MSELTRDALVVLALGTVTALATGLGALPFLFLRRATARLLGRMDYLIGRDHAIWQPTSREQDGSD